MELTIGLFTGIVFGFLLQKGEVLRFEKQIGFMLLKEMTIIKFMFSAVLVGTVLKLGDYGKITLPQILNINQWIIIAGFIAFGLTMFAWFEKKNL